MVIAQSSYRQLQYVRHRRGHSLLGAWITWTRGWQSIAGRLNPQPSPAPSRTMVDEGCSNALWNAFVWKSSLSCGLWLHDLLQRLLVTKRLLWRHAQQPGEDIEWPQWPVSDAQIIHSLLHGVSIVRPTRQRRLSHDVTRWIDWSTTHSARIVT